MKINYLRGEKIKGVRFPKEKYFIEIDFYSGNCLKFWHDQDCCEDVDLSDSSLVEDELNSLIASVILDFEIITEREERENSYLTWSFYKLQTSVGNCTIKFQGESNGYYSEEVSLGVFDSDSNCIFTILGEDFITKN